MRVMSGKYERAIIKPKKSRKFYNKDRSQYTEIVNAERKSYLSIVMDRETLAPVMYLHFRKVFGERLITEANVVGEIE